MRLVDVLCPQDFVPMLTLRDPELFGDHQQFLGCGICQGVWKMKATEFVIDWDNGWIRPRTQEELSDAFQEAMTRG
jgi:hypothetical protein